ncbi:MAG: DUF5615 family PIN-like protein [Armatimonadetes bacterium]|nr:DUF5615 family PIN-like protein [Armatimonadota bacterium]
MPDPLSYYLDEMMDPDIAKGLRRRGIDVLTTQEARKLGKPDPDQLALAHGEGRVLFTMDADFLRLHAAGRDHSGIAFAFL